MVITGRTKVFTILAHPSINVRAPRIYNHIFSRMGLDMVYIAHDVPPRAIPETMRSFSAWSNLGGFNVTIPHKEAVSGLVGCLCDVSKRIAAVNLVVRHENGTFSGYNTDGIGALRAVGEVHGAVCLMIGAGGAARAIADALQGAGVRQVLVLNRSREGSSRMCSLFGKSQVRIYQDDPLENIDLVIQATPVSKEIPFNLEVGRFKRGTRILETVMGPTALSEEALNLGLEIVPGYAMLYHQTRRNFELFTGLDLPTAFLDEAFYSVGYGTT